MQKENPVIKNYILSSEKRIIRDNTLSNTISENYLYHTREVQNTVFLFLFLSKIQ